MLPAQRRDLLLTRLERDGRLVAKDLAAELGVAEDSVRRDLRELAAAGLCQRVYGGALPVSPALADYATRGTVATDEQAAGGRRRGRARSGPGHTVLLDGGTTALAVARALPGDLRITRGDAQPDGGDRPPRPHGGGGLPARRTTVQALRRHVRRRRRGGGPGDPRRRLPARRHRRPPRGRVDHRRRGRGRDEAGTRRPAADTYVLASSEKIGAASPFTVLPLEQRQRRHHRRPGPPPRPRAAARGWHVGDRRGLSRAPSRRSVGSGAPRSW